MPAPEWYCESCGATQERPPLEPFTEWRRTTKPGKLYIHIFRWPKTGLFPILPVKGKVVKDYLLSDQQKSGLKVVQTSARVSIRLTVNAPDPGATVVCQEMGK